LKTLSPIANIAPQHSRVYETNQFEYKEALRTSSIRSLDNATDGSLPANFYGAEDATSLLKEIIVYHLFYAGKTYNAYHFINPRFTEISFDDLNMEESHVNNITAQFSYDGLFIETDLSMATAGERVTTASTLSETGISYVGSVSNSTKKSSDDEQKAYLANTGQDVIPAFGGTNEGG
jgi:hypothetical protein